MIRASRAVDDLILANGKYYADWELQFPASDADMPGLTARERATVVAALREFEEFLLAHGTLADLKQEHAGHFELHAPLDADELTRSVSASTGDAQSKATRASGRQLENGHDGSASLLRLRRCQSHKLGWFGLTSPRMLSPKW